MDRISNLPLSIIESILCLLPYQDVVRTSTLAKEWRYHWTKITKILVISDGKTFWDRDKLLHGVGQALVMHEGPIHEFTLSVGAYDRTSTEIDCIISPLSRKNTVKKLTIDFVEGDSNSRASLPISVCSMSQLTELYLNCCNISDEPDFRQLKRRRTSQTSWLLEKKEKLTTTTTGLDSLTSLYVCNSSIDITALIHLISNSPLLKTMVLKTYKFYDSGDATITNLFESLTGIESLTILRAFIEIFDDDGRIPQQVPITLVHLKYLCIEYIFFEGYWGLGLIALFARSSPNLEKLKLEIIDEDSHEEIPCSISLEEDYADIWLEHLSELEIIYLSDIKSELDVVKFILMRSPVLKKLRIFISEQCKDKELQISETILSSPRASSVVEFIVENEIF